MFIGHLAAFGLNPDLFKNINPKALVAGIRFVIDRLDFLKDDRFESCALRGGVRGEGNRASQRSGPWSKSNAISKRLLRCANKLGNCR